MSYLRFLTNRDYDSIATGEHMQQLIRNVEDRVPQAEQRAEMNMLEHLDQYYEIEKVLAVGKNIREYDSSISYPGQAWLKIDDVIYKTLKPINGLKKPTALQYWKQVVEFIDPCLIEHAKRYSQLRTYAKGEVVRFGTEYWICLIPHGYEAGEIHVPGIKPWIEVEAIPWEPFMEWHKNDVCQYEGKFYQFLLESSVVENPAEEEAGEGEQEETQEQPNEETQEEESQPAATSDDPEENENAGGESSETEPNEGDESENEEETQESEDEEEAIPTPATDDAWGLIGDYTDEYEYDYSEDARDYVVAEEKVFYPIINPNADAPTIGVNIVRDDPRNQNVVGHMARIALYYLHQIISPTNISDTRRWAYEDSMQWLHDASRFKINPQLPRKHDRETGEKKVDWALATFQKNYDPNENAWLI